MNDQLPLHTSLSPSVAHFFNAAPWPILIVNDAGTIIHVNQPLLALFGYASSELISQPLEILLPTQQHKKNVGQPESHPSNDTGYKMATDLNVRGRCKDGSEISLSIRLQTTDANQHKSTIVFITDLTAD